MEKDQTPISHDASTDALFTAAQSGDIDTARRALDAGADPNAIDRYGCYTPLRHAVFAHNTGMVRLLIERGADVFGGKRVKGGSTYLHDAVQAGKLDAVRLFLDAGLTVHERCHYERTPLLYAILTWRNQEPRDFEEIVKLLLDRGADVNAGDINNRSPLYFAAKNGCVEAVELLLKRGADVNAVSQLGQTPLISAFDVHYRLPEPEQWYRLTEMLLRAGASVVTPYINTVLHLAAPHAPSSVVRLLAGARATVNGLDGNGRTPLQLALVNADNFAALLAAGADITPLLKITGIPALFVATENNNAPAVAALLAAGCDPNKSYRGRPPLHVAVKKALPDVVSALLTGGADHLLPGKDGVTALDLARKRRRRTILPLLEAAESARLARLSVADG